MQLKEITVNGKVFTAFEGEIAPHGRLVFISGKKGFIMCGYLNLETANKKENIAAIATGVKNIEDMLNTKIVALTNKAKEVGIKIDMPVKEALEKLS